MHIGNGSEPQGLDPHVVTGVPEHHLLITMCEGLTISNPEGGANLPGMAESWEISEDGKTYIFNIRKDAKWSNGDDFVADDMVWSWMRVLTPALVLNIQICFTMWKVLRTSIQVSLQIFLRLESKL